MNGNLPSVKVLVSYGADIAALEKSDTQPLMVAATKGHAQICRWLVETAGCPVDTRTVDGQEYTALINAAGYGNAETVGVLLDLGADKEAAIYDGRRASHFAAFKGKDDCLRELIRRGVDIEAKDDNDWTPLHFAARYHHPKAVELLLESKAEVGGRVSGGPTWTRADGSSEEVEDFTAADLARTRRGVDNCVHMLLEAGDVLREELRELTDNDLGEEKEGCVVM
jgi:ankyrin repeat protein